MEYTNMKIEQLIVELEDAREEKKMIAEKIEMIEAAVINHYEVELKSELKKKPDMTGTVNIGDIKFNVAKRVLWDQAILDGVYKNFELTNEDPKEYIDVKLSVKESNYNAWPSSMKEKFTPARTVVAGKTSIKIAV